MGAGLWAGIWLGVLGLPGAAHALIITFDDLANGEVVSRVDAGIGSIDITAVNRGGGVDLAVAFDSDLTGTADPDLEFDDGSQGILLIIQENGTGCSDGFCDSPDDEGSRPAGDLVLAFEVPVLEFGTDLIDIEDKEIRGGALVFTVDDGVNLFTATVSFEELADPKSPFFRDAVYGDNLSTEIAPITAQELGGLEIEAVRVVLGGSGAIDNLNVQLVPEPGTLALVASGLLGLAAAGRRRRL